MGNPYAPPQHDGPLPTPIATRPPAPTHFRVEGDLLIAPDGVHLPEICIRYGSHGDNERKHTLVWIPWYLRLFGALSMLLAPNSTITYYLSDQADHERQVGQRIIVISLLVGLGVGIGCIAIAAPALGLTAFAGMFVGLFFGARRSNPFRLVRIDGGEVTLKLGDAAAAAFAAHAAGAGKGRRRKRQTKETKA